MAKNSMIRAAELRPGQIVLWNNAAHEVAEVHERWRYPEVRIRWTDSFVNTLVGSDVYVIVVGA